MAKVTLRKTSGKFFVTSTFGGDVEVFTKKPQGDVIKDTEEVYDPQIRQFKTVKTESIDYGYGDETICENGFTGITGRKVKPGECWRVDFKLTRVDRAAQAARAKKAKRAKRR